MKVLHDARKALNQVAVERGADPVLLDGLLGSVDAWIEEHPQHGNPLRKSAVITVRRTVELLWELVKLEEDDAS